ncbi:hypothetical protein GIB67_019250 [Kingdonia uniflora]|uniref:Malic enzyme NAD-binding domain-containing protein n=1 Tax=Kingdonia uniflora TaxID=39325 RepID=A0A7J7MZV9_9MAGN|nr:hypothetical protein GIB67_019250 [Kingdonia uniflora]
MKWAFETLQRYCKKFCMFNDDIQGTAGVALAGLLGAARAQGRPLSDFIKQKIVVVGARRFSAGIGVLSMAKQAVSRMTGDNEVTGNNPFWLLEKDGLVTKARNDIELSAAPFARGFGPGEIEGLREGANLLEVVKKVKPHVLQGLSGVGWSWLYLFCGAECTAADAFKHARENIVFASGSPFGDVNLGNGKVGHANQANNMYLFPGIGLGALFSGAHYISDGMLQLIAECIWHITTKVGVVVVREAIVEERAEGHGDSVIHNMIEKL